MRIDFFCSNGSPIGVVPPDVWTRGVGGAELALFGLTKALAAKGHQVFVWNDPPKEAEHDGVVFMRRGDWNGAIEADAFVLFRGPASALHYSTARTKIFWSCDQATTGLYHRDIIPFVDHTVCISPYHWEFFRRTYGTDLKNCSVIGLGVNNDYGRKTEKVPGRLIYCSIPDRGLNILADCWPRLLERHSDLSLIVTGDYTLWGSKIPGIHRYRTKFLRQPNVEVLGAIPRAQLVDHQLKAQIQAYPCTYPELFCLAVAECSAAGAIPVTSMVGALETTNTWGIKIEGNPHSEPWKERFVEEISALVSDPVSLEDHRARCIAGSEARSWERIADVWVGLIENGRVL